MRLRFTVSLTFERAKPPQPIEQPEYREVDMGGAMVEQIGQPRYFGFTPEPTYDPGDE